MIEFKDVSKQYGRFRALNGVNFRMEQNTALALLGPNGSGKTTLLKCLLGMAVFRQGDILFSGKSIKNDARYRNEIGYMPQFAAYPENLKVGQMISLMKTIRQPNGGSFDEELFERWDMKQFGDKTIRSLSGGMRQKLSAYLTFLFNPAVLVFDEPTAGLDPLASEILKEKILKAKAAGKTIIITSHVLSDLDELADEVLYMQEGGIRFRKPISQLKSETGTDRLGKALAEIIRKEQTA